MPPTLHTARLILRPYGPDDFAAYAAMWADPAVVRFIGGRPLSREESWARFLRQLGHWQATGFGFFALEDRATGAFAGEAGFHDLKRAIEPPIEGVMEAGWGLVAAMQGRGLAEEAMRASLGWADQNGSGGRIVCIIHPDNSASIRVAGKLGFANPEPAIYRGAPTLLFSRPRPLA